MYRISIPQESIGTVIGPGGKMIRKIQEESGGASIDIQEDGTVVVGATSEESAKKAIAMIQGLTKEVKVGEVYTGKVVRILNFGAFVEVLPGKDALVHIAELAEDPVDRVEDAVDMGDEVTIMITEIDNLGRVNASRRAVLAGETDATRAIEESAARRRNGPPGRGPRGNDRGGDRGRSQGGRNDRSGGDRGAPRQRSGGHGGDRDRGYGGGQRSSGGSVPTGGASRGWTRRATPDGPPQPPPPPPRGVTGFSTYDDEE
jgi:polyribonucleotide nucleotidyltransferase